MKTCSTCKQEKDLVEFTKRSKSKDGLHCRCKACTKVSNDAYRSQPEFNARVKTYRQSPEYRAKVKAYNQRPEVKAKAKLYKATYVPSPEAKERKKEQGRVYRARPEVKARIKAYEQKPEVKARKRALAKQRVLTPAQHTRQLAMSSYHRGLRKAAKYNGGVKPIISLEEKEAMLSFMSAIKVLTATTGIEFEVDHIHPIAKGGEHRLSNLQCITREDNIAKGDSLNWTEYSQKPSYPTPLFLTT